MRRSPTTAPWEHGLVTGCGSPTWDFTLIGADDLILSALDVSRRFDCALHDGLYLALAEEQGVEFITADQELFNKTRDKASWIRWIGHYQP